MYQDDNASENKLRTIKASCGIEQKKVQANKVPELGFNQIESYVCEFKAPWGISVPSFAVINTLLR